MSCHGSFTLVIPQLFYFESFCFNIPTALMVYTNISTVILSPKGKAILQLVACWKIYPLHWHNPRYSKEFTSCMKNSMEPDQLASSEASWFGSTLFFKDIIEPVHEISNNVVCATSKASDQPAHMRSLSRAFAGRLSILWLSSYWLNTIWSF